MNPLRLSILTKRQWLSSVFPPRLLLLPALFGSSLPHEAWSNDNPASIGLFLESKVAAPDMYQEIAQAKSTVLVPARPGQWGVDTFRKEEWEKESLEWSVVLPAAQARADELAQNMTIEWERDQRQVIRYASIRSEDPFLTSVIYSDVFLRRLERKL
ncbi:MAG: hypothetical protein AAF191_16265, partial [Verrucomicrobiota bacterium]